MATFVQTVGQMGRATSKGNETEVKDETPFIYAHAGILSQVIVICDPTLFVNVRANWHI